MLHDVSRCVLRQSSGPQPRSHVPPTRAADLAAVAAALNGRPRKTLGWQTPAEPLDKFLHSCQQASVATTP